MERFFEKVIKQDDGCWLWTGAGTRYGTFGIGRRHERIWISAHRFTYLHLKGPIPDGMEIDHLCRNKRCVNPDHLRVVTPRENISTNGSPPALNMGKTHCKHGHEFTVQNTYVDKNGGRYCNACMRARTRRYRAAARAARG